MERTIAVDFDVKKIESDSTCLNFLKRHANLKHLRSDEIII